MVNISGRGKVLIQQWRSDSIVAFMTNSKWMSENIGIWSKISLLSLNLSSPGVFAAIVWHTLTSRLQFLGGEKCLRLCSRAKTSPSLCSSQQKHDC